MGMMQKAPVGSFDLDYSEVTALAKRLKKAIKVNGSDVSKAIDPKTILWHYGAPVGIMILVSHTPVGDDRSNWGYWDYGTFREYPSDHAKGTLRRGWLTTIESEAHNNLTIKEDADTAFRMAVYNYRPKRTQNTHYYIDLENCVSYAPYVEYGHKVVYPWQNPYDFVKERVKTDRGMEDEYTPVRRHKYVSGPFNGKPAKRAAHGYVPGQYFVKRCLTARQWEYAAKAMHNEYYKRLIAVISSKGII